MKSQNNMTKPQRQGDHKKEEKSSQQLIEIPKELEHAAEELIENKQELILNLKKLHMQQQSELVRGITVMSNESKKIIDDITVIEGDIDVYQGHIDQWIKKIESLRVSVDKIKRLQGPFQLKARNMGKIKEYLAKQIKKQR